MEFDLHSSEIPRGAIVTVAICSISAKQAGQITTNSSQQTSASKNLAQYSTAKPLAYANFPLFDYKNCLIQGKVSVFTTKPYLQSTAPLWSKSGGPTEFMSAFNRLEQEPGDTRTGPCLHLDFEVHRRRYLFPTFDDYVSVLNTDVYQQQLAKEEKEKRNRFIENPEELQAAIEPLHSEDLTQEERDLIWANRENLLQHFPDSLPLLLSAVRWSNRLHVGILYQLLRRWKQPSLELIITLLVQYNYDPELQQCLVDRLSHALQPDTLLQTYLLQILQLLRLQPYVYNPLVLFLLRRAFSNQRFAMFLFWMSVSEMSSSSSDQNDKFRTSIMLVCEVIFRCSSGLRPMLMKQHRAIAYLKQLVSEIKQQKEEDQSRYFASRITSKEAIETLSGVVSPLHPTVRLGYLRPERCRMLKSAKLPVWVSWDINDRFADPDVGQYELIFKVGDDLRQDLLILQLLWLMDDCWLRAGIDTRIKPYSTMPVGREIGFIEVISRAKTVMNIQKQYPFGGWQVVDQKTILHWLKERNPSVTSYSLARANFTQSCAAYCVATFILGVGDRHPDNIMICENGRLSHIDFGHFLGHRKQKFGIERERVPFVLTNEFINVIIDDHGPKSDEFMRFQEVCGQLYLLIRGAAPRLMTILTLTVPAGLPELKDLKEAMYVEEQLKIKHKDQDLGATKYFQGAFSKAYEGQWSTKLDWFFHWMKHRRG